MKSVITKAYLIEGRTKGKRTPNINASTVSKIVEGLSTIRTPGTSKLKT